MAEQGLTWAELYKMLEEFRPSVYESSTRARVEEVLLDEIIEHIGTLESKARALTGIIP